MLENTRQLGLERGLSIATSLNPAEQFPQPDASFPLVACRVAAHHFNDREAFLEESRRVLKPGGHFLLIDGRGPDEEPEAADWIHQVEKLRDPSHERFLSPAEWSAHCGRHGLSVLRCENARFKQPDLEWYFHTTATPEENRVAACGLVRTAPEAARRVFRISEEEGKTIWWWPRLTLRVVKLCTIPNGGDRPDETSLDLHPSVLG